MLYFHGGAYVAGSPLTHRAFVARLAKAGGVRALVADYRLAPEHRFPATVDDALAVYAWLVGDQGIDPGRLLVVGDRPAAD
jgi:monoterpene epsilon-lactone hydrolase